MEQPTRRAEERHGWWPGWIWSIPIAALGIVAWLAVRSWTNAGPSVTVVFPVIADLRSGDTQVTFEGYKVGQVEAVALEPDLRHMRARLDLDPDMRGHLGKGTEFWIIGRSPSLAHLSDLKAVIDGVSIGIRPAPGQPQKQYQGLAEDPVLGFGATGTMVTLHATELGAVQAGTPIYYLGEQAGEVQRTAMSGDHAFTITAFIERPYDRLVHDGTRFWRAGPVHLSTGGNGPSLRFQSLPALFQGAIAFVTPADGAATPIAGAGHDFTLFDDEDAAQNAPDAEGLAYRAVFDSASGVPDADAPVTLMGKRVGSVKESRLEYDPARERLEVVATLVIEPRDIPLAGDARWTAPRRQMDAMFRSLVGQGLRATLDNSPPVIGGEEVALRFVPGTAGALGEGSVPEIPASPGGNVAGAIAQANDVLSKLDALPFATIADQLAAVSAHLAHLTSSPAIAATLHQLDETTANLQRVTADLRREVPPALGALRNAVNEASASLGAARQLLSAQSAVPSGPGTADLPQTLYEITRAARALREVADLLDRQPSSVLTGRQAHE